MAAAAACSVDTGGRGGGGGSDRAFSRASIYGSQPAETVKASNIKPRAGIIYQAKVKVRYIQIS